MKLLPPLTNNQLKNKSRILLFPIDFGDFKIDGFNDTSALISAVLEADSRKLGLLAPQTIFYEGPPGTSKFWYRMDL